MDQAFSGGCACQSIRYTVARAPLAMLNCHCSDCQVSSGAPFASGVVIMTADLALTGEPRYYTVKGSSGALVSRSFCPACGTPLLTQSAANPHVTSIRFPTLDDCSAFKPMLDIYTADAQAWVCLDADIPHFPQSPPAPA
ncbi:GFA family protein [Massilia sp. PAMC28688]|uniref:GFA family protein n=1 Tax=Massilia sp. PAMC28688 TaxID=2861283 RepID=UPI001C626E35|nr:GFA family protein [Massilia sp. PAMC28688]QYF93607.1 GFA family protein [Massilia sp. PAMC28688]